MTSHWISCADKQRIETATEFLVKTQHVDEEAYRNWCVELVEAFGDPKLFPHLYKLAVDEILRNDEEVQRQIADRGPEWR